ncbi:MAG: outer membrane protein assembly factor [Roseitalea sp.]|jgi:translocation and assembly module TamA|nr:outer membrane protein assembly factor [Roseitalea sp.]MBO6723949.1 outer membrane protein assembly factor [Roseitalea sp.]MBO6745409.1 outer membrane protein assembly factor [Roseitalea sp.]
MRRRTKSKGAAHEVLRKGSGQLSAGRAACRAGALALAFALAWTARTPDAHALELFGLCLFGDCRDAVEAPDLIDPKPYGVALTVEGADADMEAAVKAGSSLWGGRNAPAAGSAGLLSRARADYRRIQASLYDEARYGGTISIRADGREVADLPAGHDFADGTVFAISVRPGPVYTFGALAIDNLPPPSVDPGDRVDAPSTVGFQTGSFARAGAVRQAGQLAVKGWRQQGHAIARITEREVVANHPSRTLRVRLVIDPGPRANYGAVTVEGTDRMIPSFVARQTGLLPGAEYDPDDVERANERLRRLGVFNAATVRPAQTVGGDGTLPVAVTVEERKLRRIGAGATYSTLDGFGAEAFWLHRNLWGRAERLRIEAGISGLDGSLDAGNYDYRLGATLGLPGRFTPDTDVTLGVLAEREVLDTYTRTGAETSIGMVHYQSNRLTWSGDLFVDYAEFTDAMGTRRLGLVGGSAGVEYDARNDPLDATAGFLASATVTPFYEWEFGNPAVQLDGELRAYQALGERERTVLAGRLTAGSIVGPAPAFLPPDRLYFAGGGTSVRGFAYRSIGGADSTTTGGKSLIEASAEIRQAVTDTISIVGFVDAAMVGTDSLPAFDRAPRAGAGLGVRYKTGLGPLRLDAATPLNPRPGDGWFAIYAGIGQAF